MVSEQVKVKNTNMEWIKDKVLQALHSPKYHVRQTFHVSNRMEFNIESNKFKTDKIKLTITTNERRAGLVNVAVKPQKGAYNGMFRDKFSLEIWETVAAELRFSLDGENAIQKCWNCFEDRDFRHNFCSKCGKT